MPKECALRTSWRIGYQRLSIVNGVDDQISRRCNQSRGEIAGHEKGGWRELDRDVPIGIDEVVEVQDVTCGNIFPDEVGIEVANCGDGI
jgi:hypothetical protein